MHSLYLLSFLGLSWRLPRQKRAYQLLALSIWSVVLYFWFMSLLVLPILRYMVPAVGLLFILWPLMVSERRQISTDSLISKE